MTIPDITPGPFSKTLKNVLLDILAIEDGLTPGSEQSSALVEQCEKDTRGILADEGTSLSKHLRLALLMEHHINEAKQQRDSTHTRSTP